MIGDAIEKKETTYRAQAVWNTLGLVGALAGDYVILIFLIRTGNIAEAGIFSLCLAVVSIFQEISSYNARTFQIADNYTRFSESTYVFARFFSIVISSFCYCIFLLYMYYDKKTVLSMSLLLFARNIGIFVDVFGTKLQIKKRLDILGKSYLVTSVCNVVSFILSYILYSNIVFSFFYAMLFSRTFSVLFTFYIYKKIIGIDLIAVIKYEKKYIYDAYRLLKLCFPLCIAVLLSAFISAIPKILLERYSNNEAVGVFSALTTPAILIPTIASSLFAPYIVYFADLLRNAKYKVFIRRSLLIGGIICFCCFATLLLNSFLGITVFRFIYGNKIADFHSFFIFILIAYFMLTFSTILTTMLIIADARKFILFSSIIISAVCCVLLPQLIGYYKLYGACIGIVVIYLFQMLLLLFGLLNSLRHYDLRKDK